MSDDVRTFAFDPAITDNSPIPLRCFALDGRCDWARVLQWICPDLTANEASECVKRGGNLMWGTTLVQLRLLVDMCVRDK